jgi:Na+-transporting methylmalonyl-CoA/oxaloacetate decarboxylase gamma subunit
MCTELLLSLQITLLGMGLVFGAIILLWGMMTLLTRLTSRIKSGAPQADADNISMLRAQAAAIAVSVALAEQSQSGAHPLNVPPTAIVSAWQLGMRTRQMHQKGASRVRRD